MILTKQQFDAWARWVHGGCLVRPQTSVLGVLIEYQGVPPRGAGGSKPLYYRCVEADIEAAVITLAGQEPAAVVVLRLEFGATKVARLNAKPNQRDKAHAIGISLRTYQTRLSRAKSFINATVR